jgi:hypothetical protein
VRGGNLYGHCFIPRVQCAPRQTFSRHFSRSTVSVGPEVKKLVVAILLISSSAWAQTKPGPKNIASRVDECAPIGQTADRQPVYSMKCKNLPAPPSPPPSPQAEVKGAPVAEPEVERSGIFGLSYSRKPAE